MSTQVRESIANPTTVEARTRHQETRLGNVSLTVYEREILGWSRERRLREFQKANEGLEVQVLENKLLWIDTLSVGNGEILDILRLNPTLSWEKVRDVLLGGPVDGYTSTFHSLGDINYPEYFWKATIENERENLMLRDRGGDELGHSAAGADEASSLEHLSPCSEVLHSIGVTYL